MGKNENQLPYVVKLIDPLGADPGNDNMDVYVEYEDGRKYVGSFFTIENIRSVMSKDRRTGESRGGIYFWASDLIVVERIDQAIIEEAIADLMEEGFFEQAFDGPFFTSSEEG